MCARHKSTELLKLSKYSTVTHCMNNQPTMVSVWLINDLTFQSSLKNSPGPRSTLSAFSSTAPSLPPIPLVYFHWMLRSFVVLLSLQDGTPSFIPCVCPSITLAINPYTESTNCLWNKIPTTASPNMHCYFSPHCTSSSVLLCTLCIYSALAFLPHVRM